MDPRLPLPNSLRCPALALFRKYNYPDKDLVDAIKDEEVKKHLNLISKVAVELKDDGTIQEYGRSIEPEHVKRRTAHSRAEQEGKDAGTGPETRDGSTGGVTGSEGNQQNLVISEGRSASEDHSPSRGISESTEREVE
jgi:hypothetical protein